MVSSFLSTTFSAIIPESWIEKTRNLHRKRVKIWDRKGKAHLLNQEEMKRFVSHLYRTFSWKLRAVFGTLISLLQANPTIKTASALSFSKLDFVIKGSKPLTKKERRQKLSGRDYAALQKKVENRNELIEKIRSNNPEKAQNLENKIKWDTAIKRAEGKKVKVTWVWFDLDSCRCFQDDLDLLSKAVKRKDKTRQVRKKKWDDRVKKVEQDKQRRQDKRQANIDKRRDEKVKKKLERVHKKGRVV